MLQLSRFFLTFSIFSSLCFGGTLINIGVFSFDEFLPPSATPGVNQFTIANLSGNPNSGGFALLPDFPVISFISFSNVNITLYSASETTRLELEKLDPGFSSDPILQFPSTNQFRSARFQAELPNEFRLYDGRLVRTTSSLLDFSIEPFTGTFLSPGSDFVVLTVEVEQTVVPEPASVISLGLALTFLFIARPSHSARHQSKETK